MTRIMAAFALAAVATAGLTACGSPSRTLDEAQMRNYVNAAVDATAADSDPYVRGLALSASEPQYPGGPTYREDIESDGRIVCGYLMNGASDYRAAVDRLFVEKYNGGTPLPIAYEQGRLASETLCPA